METKKFKPYDKVLVRYNYYGAYSRTNRWFCTLYSHYDEGHNTMTLRGVDDNDILPYEGNEHLVGTSDEPDEEIRLEEGEWGFATGVKIDEIAPNSFDIIQFCDILSGRIQSIRGYYYDYFIRFKDFDPFNMEETKKHILCVKDSRIVRYKR